MGFDVEYDVVVIGSGASGKSAAYTICSESDLSVCILEKQPMTGGTAKHAEGMMAVESFLQVGRPVSDWPDEPMPEDRHWPTYEEVFKCYMEYSHYRANPDLVRAFLRASGETIEILTKLGIEFTPRSNLHDDPEEFYVFHCPEGMGEHVQEVLERACINGGVEIYTSTPAKELLMDDGRVIGVRAIDADGNEIFIGAKAVIIASGGWADDRQLLEQYSWMSGIGTSALPQNVGINNSGDGLKMAIAAGADISKIGCIMLGSNILGKSRENALFPASYQPTLWVNKKGRRFYDESIGTSPFNTGLLNAQQKDGSIYIIHSGKTLRHLAEEGSDVGMGGMIRYHSPFSGIPEKAQEAMENGDDVAWIANTPEELAAAAGFDVETFVNAVNRYNELCAKGYDDDYLKPSQYLIPIDEAPFVAIRKNPAVRVSCSGITVNENLQALSAEDLEPIPGLYAVGNEASGLYGDSYNMKCPGSLNGFAHTSGRLAARHAISVIKAI